MPKESVPGFEIPNEIRQFAEQSFEQARKALDGIMTTAEKAVTTLEGQASIAQAGAKDVRQKAFAFAEQNVASSFEFAQRLLRAKDVQEVMQLQAEFTKTQMAALSDQAKDLGESATKAARDAAKTG